MYMHAQEKKHKKKEKEKRKSKKARKEGASPLRPSSPTSVSAGVSQEVNALLPSVYGGVATITERDTAPKRLIGMQLPEEAAAEQDRSQRVHRVYDDELGVHRRAHHIKTKGLVLSN